MSDEKVLTKEIAEQFPRHLRSLNDFTAIRIGAARVLGALYWEEDGELELDGLTSLSVATARSLAKCQWSLELNGLTKLLPSCAKELAKYAGTCDVAGLHLAGLTKLSDAAAEKFSVFGASRPGCLALSLDGLQSLSDDAAESLSKCECWHLSLDGLTSLSDDAAESLSKHKGDLCLNGLTSLSEAAAESLSKHKGDLQLAGLTSLSDTAAESLSKHGCGGNRQTLPYSEFDDQLSFRGWNQRLRHPEKVKNTALDNLPASAAKILRDAGHGE